MTQIVDSYSRKVVHDSVIIIDHYEDQMLKVSGIKSDEKHNWMPSEVGESDCNRFPLIQGYFLIFTYVK